MFSSPAATLSFPPTSAGSASHAAGAPQDQTRLAGVAAAQLAALERSRYASQIVAFAKLLSEAGGESYEDPTAADDTALLMDLNDTDLVLLLQQELVSGDATASARWRMLLPNMRSPLADAFAQHAEPSANGSLAWDGCNRLNATSWTRWSSRVTPTLHTSWLPSAGCCRINAAASLRRNSATTRSSTPRPIRAG